ncbi:MAG: hypothetical protein U0S49_00250 [Rhodospirillales bacterium]|nr:hypothetical protein [Rhodospirillales bacterium]
MTQGEKTLYHAVISVYLNIGLLDPRAVCRRVHAEYRNGRVPLNAAEGFIRQIIGWREYMRGIYWLKMPGYAETNFFGAKRPLPEFYWTGETDMNCLRQCITQTRKEAYAPITFTWVTFCTGHGYSPAGSLGSVTCRENLACYRSAENTRCSNWLSGEAGYYASLVLGLCFLATQMLTVSSPSRAR